METSPTGLPERPAPRGLLGIASGLGMWAIAMLYSFLRPNLWILDLILIPVMWILAIAGLALLAVGLVRLLAARGEHRVGLPGTAALIVVGLVVVLVTGAIGAWWRFAPHAWFAAHRPLYEQALNTDPGDDYYGARLPFHLSFLSATGKVSGDRDGARFFPQWIGIPDDAGGYWYSPNDSPEGNDMYGMICEGPHDLGDGWWSCGLSD